MRRSTVLSLPLQLVFPAMFVGSKQAALALSEYVEKVSINKSTDFPIFNKFGQSYKTFILSQ